MNREMADREIRGLTADSRRVEPGWLFAAIPGARADGRAYIGEALQKGAAAVLAPTGTDRGLVPPETPLILDDNPRRRLALSAAAFYRHQPRYIAAVTGTNGKTSVVTFVRQMWEALGQKATSLGTLGLIPPRPQAPDALTTPDPVDLMRCLADLAENGFDHLALEASSHGLDQYRLDGVRISAAAFTNLSRDHLDYHASMEAYLDAKARLFEELLPDGGTAVLNADIPEFEALRSKTVARGLSSLTYGRGGRDLRLLEMSPGGDSLTLDLEVFGYRQRLALEVAGTFQAMNALAALGLVLAEGVDPLKALEALQQIRAVPGRIESVGETPSGGKIFVDYAHTSGALETVLRALRPHTANRLHVLFGCGGDRDRGKRPMMGQICAELADVVIVTDDNPRTEDPATIRAEILQAVPTAREIGDRRQAIVQATADLQAGDVLVIAGKGHESGQIVGDRVLPFDDREVARAAIRDLAREGSR